MKNEEFGQIGEPIALYKFILTPFADEQQIRYLPAHGRVSSAELEAALFVDDLELLDADGALVEPVNGVFKLDSDTRYTVLGMASDRPLTQPTQSIPEDCCAYTALHDRVGPAWDRTRKTLSRYSTAVHCMLLVRKLIYWCRYREYEKRLKSEVLKENWFPPRLAGNREAKKNFKKAAHKFVLIPYHGHAVLGRTVVDPVLKSSQTFRVPTTEDEVVRLLYKVHCAREGGNQDGRDKMLRKLAEQCTFWGWRQLVEVVLKSCAVHQAHTGPRPCEPLRPILATEPFEHFFLDFFQLSHSPVEGRFYVLVLIDHFSKYVWAQLTMDRMTETVEQFLRQVFTSKQAPAHLQSDNGKEFRSALIQQLCDEANVRITHGRPYRPQSQGAVERVNATIANALIKHLLDDLAKGDVDMHALLAQVVQTYNSSPPAGRRFAPIQVVIAYFNFSNRKLLSDKHVDLRRA